MTDPTRDVNHRDFFSDDNMEALAEDATFADWEPGPNESPSNVTRSRPAGDNTFTPWSEEIKSEGSR
jgi:hypothetical protein